MSKDRFKFMWRNFHVHLPENFEEEAKDNTGDNSTCEGDEDGGDDLVEKSMERVQQDQEEGLEEIDLI